MKLFKKKWLYLQCLARLKALNGQRLGRYTYGKRRFCTLWFWRSMNFANSTVSQKQSNAERLMRCIIYILISFGCILHSLVGRIDYILTQAWGFRRCSFRLTGQCESLRIVERVTEWLCAFFLCINNNNPNNPAGAYRFYSFCIWIMKCSGVLQPQVCWSY